jgi:hypothetical protein
MSFVSSCNSTLKPRAIYMGGMNWQCPFCQHTNLHSLPFPGATLSDMIGDSRRCDYCFCDYELTFLSLPKKSFVDHNPPSER